MGPSPPPAPAPRAGQGFDHEVRALASTASHGLVRSLVYGPGPGLAALVLQVAKEGDGRARTGRPAISAAAFNAVSSLWQAEQSAPSAIQAQQELQLAPRACEERHPPTGGDARGGAGTASLNEQENAYLRKNVEQLRQRKRQLEQQVARLAEGVQSLEQQNMQRYQTFHERAIGGSCDIEGLEISSLHQQLGAVMMLKDALHIENLELQQRLAAAEHERAERHQLKHTACVICIDNLANMVCLPCKHLALCTSCSQQSTVGSCPLCRSDVIKILQIYIR